MAHKRTDTKLTPQLPLCHGDVHYHHEPELNHAINTNPKPNINPNRNTDSNTHPNPKTTLTQNSLHKLHDGDRDYYYCQRQKESHNSDDDRCGPF